MFRKMLFQGLFAAAVIAGSAGLYAIATAAEPAQTVAASGSSQAPAEAGAGTGYLHTGRERATESHRDRRESREGHEMREREKHQRSGAYVERNGKIGRAHV